MKQKRFGNLEDVSWYLAELENLNDKEQIIARDAIAYYGERAQEETAIEECAELIQAITHKHRGRFHNIAEGIADVEIMLEQLKVINHCHEQVKQWHDQKIKRLQERIKERWHCNGGRRQWRLSGDLLYFRYVLVMNIDGWRSFISGVSNAILSFCGVTTGLWARRRLLSIRRNKALRGIRRRKDESEAF